MSALERKEGAAPWPVTAPNANNAHSITPSINSYEKIDNPEASLFLNHLAEGEPVTFQTFDDKKGRYDSQLVRVLHGTLDEHLPHLRELNQEGAGIFVTVNKTDLQGRASKNITKVRAIFVDLDGAPLEPLFSCEIEPHIIVETSPQRYHAYWLVESVQLEDFSSIQKAFIARFQSDPSVHDLPRVMRLPGFLHQKGDPFLVKIHSTSGMQPIPVESFLKSFSIDLKATKVIPAPKLGVNNDPILKELEKRGMVKRPLPNRPGSWDILCPFSSDHTTGEEGTAYFEAHTNGYKGAGFKCLHAHCVDKGIEELKKYLNIAIEDAWDEPIPLIEELLPVTPLNADMLPKALRPWLEDIAERMQVPLDFLAAPAMVILGSLIGRKIGIFPKAHDDWLVIPNLWGAVVGRPAFLKSPSIAEVMKPLDELAAFVIQAHAAEQAHYEQQLLWHEAQKSARKDALKKVAKKAEQTMPSMPILTEPVAPHLKRYKTEDSTIQKMGEILQYNPQGILVHRDELTGWFKVLDQYGHEGDRAFYLESWNGSGAYTIDRIGRGTLHVEALCISIIGGIQPGPLQQYIHQAISGGGGDDGLLQRFQLLVWPDPLKTWKNVDRIPNLQAKDQANRIFKKLDAFAPFEPGSNSDFKTYTLRFSLEAQQLFDNWRYQLEHRLRDGSLSPAFESHLAKYRSLMPKIALICCLIDTPEESFPPKEVGEMAALQAIQWCAYLETHAKRMYASAEAPGMESARALLERIQAGDLSDGFSIREVYHSRHWSKLDTMEKVTTGVKILEEFGWVRCESLKSGGRPSTSVRIHPHLRKKRDNEQSN